jgi:hypothetical protein
MNEPKVLWVKVRGRQTDWVSEKQEIQVMNHRDGKTPHRGVADIEQKNAAKRLNMNGFTQYKRC